MNGMVSGTDVIFEVPKQGFDPLVLLDTVLDVWPDSFFQNADEASARPLAAIVADLEPGVSHEFFIYKDKASAESWDAEGWTVEHGDDMAHFLIRDPGSPDHLQVTLVVGSLASETVRLVGAVQEVVERVPAAPERSYRLNWEAELQAAGYTHGRAKFYDVVDDVRRDRFPGWTAEELACNPSEALQFCAAVRQQTSTRLPDRLVMKALLNRRKGRKATGA